MTPSRRTGSRARRVCTTYGDGGGLRALCAGCVNNYCTMYLAVTDEQTYDLEYATFDEGELQSFRNIMVASAEEMLDELGKDMVSKAHNVSCLGSQVGCTIGNLNDEWSGRLEARCTTIAISNCLVPRLPWEELFWGEVSHAGDSRGAAGDVL